MLNIIYPLKTTFLDYPDNESEAILIFIMGCRHFCKNCQNSEFKYKDYNIGTKKIEVKELFSEIESLANRINSNKVVLSGGDPLYEYNVDDVRKLLKLGKSKYDFMIYTGHSMNYIKKSMIDGFKYIKCGIYQEDKKQTSEKTDDYIKFASSNQNLYDANYFQISENGIYYFNNNGDNEEKCQK